MSVLLGNSGASVILGSSGGGVVRSTSGDTKSVIQQSDFTYLGCFRVPTNVNSTYGTDYGYGLTHRYVGGTMRLMSVTGAPNANLLYEMTPPGTLDTDATPDTFATEVAFWGDIYQDKRYLYQDGGTGGNVWGLHWDDTDQRLYWMYQDSYNAANDADCCIGYSTLNDTTTVGTGIGAWRMPASIGCKVVKGMTGVPSAFASTYLSGKRLAVGFGGYESAATTGPASMGPALFAIDPPSLGVTADRDYLPTPVTLINHPYNSTAYTSPMRGVRDNNYTTEYDTWYAVGATGYYTWSDLWRQSGVWIDTPTKHGFLVLMVLGNGRVWYELSKGHATSGTHDWVVYDPADLASVAASTESADLVQPSTRWLGEFPHITYPLAGWENEAGPIITGMTFDATTRRLYVLVRFAFKPDLADRPLVYVYELGA